MNTNSLDFALEIPGIGNLTPWETRQTGALAGWFRTTRDAAFSPSSLFRAAANSTSNRGAWTYLLVSLFVTNLVWSATVWVLWRTAPEFGLLALAVQFGSTVLNLMIESSLYSVGMRWAMGIRRPTGVVFRPFAYAVAAALVWTALVPIAGAFIGFWVLGAGWYYGLKAGYSARFVDMLRGGVLAGLALLPFAVALFAVVALVTSLS